MNKLFATLGLFWALLCPALAVDPATQVGNAAYSVTNTDVRINTTTAFTVGRTWTLPFAAGTCIGQTCQPAADRLEIVDTAGALSMASPLTIAPQSGDTINGNAANLIISAAGSRVVLIPTSANNWKAQVYGDFVAIALCPGTGSTATVTITIATPGVITDTAHGLTGACPVVYTTSGALPTGITSGTTYWVIPSTITTDTYQIATSVANALAGTAVATSGSQSGTQTRTGGSPLTSTTAVNITGLSLSQGDWDCRGIVSHNLAASTSVTLMAGGLNQTTGTIPTQGQSNNTTLSTAANVMGVAGLDLKVGPTRQSLTATTNLYLVARDTFTVSTDVAYGSIACRRAQ